MPLNVSDSLFLIAIIMFSVGMLIVIIGIIVLIRRTMNKDIHTLATQTNRLVQKGIVDDIAGLVGNASTLLNAINQLIRTSAGIGAFLILLGLVFISASIFLLTQILL